MFNMISLKRFFVTGSITMAMLFAISLSHESFGQCSGVPILTSPTVTSITHNSATIGASADNNGTGGCNCAYGVRYHTVTPVAMPAATEVAVGNTTSTQTYTQAIAGLTPATQYYYIGYGTNVDGTGTTDNTGAVFFYTLSSPATQVGVGAFTSVVNGAQIDLAFPAANTLTANGYLIFKSNSASPPAFTLTNGTAPAGFLVDISDDTDVAHSDAAVSSGNTYTYTIVPYTWDGVNPETYNYTTASARSTTTTIISLEPTNHVTAFAIDGSATTPSQLKLTWTDATANVGETAPTGYLIVARSASGSFPAVADGANVANDTDLSNDAGAFNVGVGVETYTFTGLDASTQYFFEIYPYTGAALTRNYKTAAPPAVNGTTGALATTLASLATGLATSPMDAGSPGNTTQNAILGFSLVSNGSQTVTALRFTFNQDPGIFFSAYSLVQSTDNSFATTGDNAIVASTSAPSGTGPYYITLTPGAPIDITALKNLFLVASVNGGVNATTVPVTGIQPSLTSADVTLSGGSIAASTVTGSTYTFRASQASTIAIHSTDGVTSPINLATYGTRTTTPSGSGTDLTSANTTSLANFRIRDGGGSTDIDTQGTTVTALTITISNPTDLNGIVLYGGTALGSLTKIAGTETTINPAINPATLSFSGLSLTAPDNATYYIQVRTTFNPAGVTDNNNHVVVVTAATIDPNGSQATATPLTGATTGTGAAINNINVVATELAFTDAMPIITTPSPATFGVTVVAVDANGNTDLDETSSVTLKISGGPTNTISASEAGGITQSLVQGTYSWTTATVALAGTYTLTGDHATFGNSDDATGTLEVKSLGVKITDGLSSNPATVPICYGIAYIAIGDIVLAEQDPADFGTGTNVTYSIQLPFGFRFDPSAIPTVTATGAEVTISATPPSFLSANTAVQFTYSVTGTSNLNTIKIAGLMVNYTLDTAPTENTILRRGGSAVQEGNAVEIGQNHATLNVYQDANTGYDFTVAALPGQAAILPTETNFSVTVPGVLLQPNDALPTPVSYSFTGNGVSFASSYNSYVFSPASVGVGNTNPVTYIVIKPGGCSVRVPKNFAVYSSSINNLEKQYCITDTNPAPLSIPPVSYTGQTLPASNQYAVYIQPYYKYVESIVSDGAGKLTITSTNHGLAPGSSTDFYCSIYDDFWNFLAYLPAKNYAIGDVTANSFSITEPSVILPAGTYANSFGYAFISYVAITNATYDGVGNRIVVTAPNHGLNNNVMVRVYIQGMSDNGTALVYDWYNVEVDPTLPNQFKIVPKGPVTGTFGGYGEVDIFTYRVSQFIPANVATFNSRLKDYSTVYVGFFVNNPTPPYPPYIYRWEAVRIANVPTLDFGPLTGILSAEYCAGTSAFTLVGNQTDGAFAGPGIADGGIGLNTASFNPGGVPQDQDLVITYSFEDENGCFNQVSKTTRVVSPIVAPDDQDNEFCQFGPEPITLSSPPDAAYELIWYNDPGLSQELARGESYKTSLSTASPQVKIFYLIKEIRTNKCRSPYAEIGVTIKQAPQADFTAPPPCVDREFTVTGPNGPIKWTWDFGDGGVADGQVAQYMYTVQGTKKITLTIEASDGCTNSVTKDVNIGPNPIPDFTYNKICNGDATEFEGDALNGFTYEWDFGDGTVIPPGAAKNVSHSFTSAVNTSVAMFDVKLTSYTASGCFGEITKAIPILPLLDGFDEENPYKLVATDNGKGFWTPLILSGPDDMLDGTVPFWEYETADKLVIKSTGPVWVTRKTDFYTASTQATLNSPCLKLTNFTKPVLSLDYIVNSQEKADGIVFEYTVDEGETWIALGDTDSGIDWHNTPLFFSGKIGNSLTGWSGPPSDQISEWKTGRNSLDEILNADTDANPATSTNKVRFRFYFASDATANDYDGFAFTNLEIAERNRMVLVENFTNTGAAEYAGNNTNYTALGDNELVKVQYHVGGPDEDLIYAQNKIEPAARSAYYGVTNTEAVVPRVFIDGHSQGDLTEAWSSSYLEKEKLKPSDLKIVMETVPAGPDRFHVRMRVTALRDLPAPLDQTGPRLVAHIGIIQKNVNGNLNVIRKLLPTPTGMPLTLPFTIAEGERLIDPGAWIVNLDAIDFAGGDELAVVGFVQNETNRNVWQSAIELNPIDVPSVVTGVEDPKFASKVKVYPNPSNEVVTVELPEISRTSTPIRMTDTFGKEISRDMFRAGEQRKTMNTKDLAAGVYFVQLQTEKGLIIKKLVVAH